MSSSPQRCGAPKKSGKSTCRREIGDSGICPYHGWRGPSQHSVAQEPGGAAEQVAGQFTSDPLTTDDVRQHVGALEHAMSRMLEDPDGQLPQFLRMRSKMRHYSWGNVMLMLSQKPDGTLFAPWSVWRELGRKMKDGEAPVLINVPRKYLRRTPDGEPLLDEQGNKQYGVRFALEGKVYDLSQTEGDPLPEPPVTKLEGDPPQAMVTQLGKVAAEHGIPISYEPLEPGHGGYYHLEEHRIVINADNSSAQQAKTLAHELGHALDPAVREAVDEHGPAAAAALHQGDKEAVAEATAFVVAAHYGLDSAGYSVGYVATWCGGDVERFRRLLDRIEATTTAICPPDPAELAMADAREAAAETVKANKAAKRRPKQTASA